ncbi:Hsp20/alpha crystallin family protein [Micromonospora sp. WMMD712]|uniref:Hsp20/alpha crystallin family protein n=1 Tax=Micromonospora sp. WMMD712 TaxID=3016096 RepID=UPI00249B02D3|nr:Hsp20/alpha crystallin family protein [Micromonospora sp. WMMD712]WFE56697.1 Hsp20/alpha crystallin family protein [Micromonospora sp. WMMD712]
MSTVTKFRGGGTLAPFDWTSLSWLPMLAPTIRVEDYLDGDRYVVRAELPGVDPAKDVRITLTGENLRLDVVRRESHADKVRTEFHYGSFSRLVPLPAGLKQETLRAAYADGILEITATVGEPEPAAREIPITVEHGAH